MPGDGNHRRARMRLARHRPSPNRVRARVQGGGEEPGGEGTQRIDWAKWGTVAGVIAGIGTLLFTAIATYYGAVTTSYGVEVAKDQLEQSREDAAREDRDQASQVAAWTERDETEGFSVRLRNRSQDPVDSIRIRFWVYIDREGRDHATVAQFTVIEGMIGPCTDLIVEEKPLRYTKKFLGRTYKIPDDAGVEIKSVEFRDRDGVRWLRDLGSGLVQVDPHSTGRRLVDKPPGVKLLHGLHDGRQATKPASGCDGERA
ncbi:hypothetical protein ACWGII_25950 [Streptomyces sp. NPDC054855]